MLKRIEIINEYTEKYLPNTLAEDMREEIKGLMNFNEKLYELSEKNSSKVNILGNLELLRTSHSMKKVKPKSSFVYESKMEYAKTIKKEIELKSSMLNIYLNDIKERYIFNIRTDEINKIDTVELWVNSMRIEKVGSWDFKKLQKYYKLDNENIIPLGISKYGIMKNQYVEILLTITLKIDCDQGKLNLEYDLYNKEGETIEEYHAKRRIMTTVNISNGVNYVGETRDIKLFLNAPILTIFVYVDKDVELNENMHIKIKQNKEEDLYLKMKQKHDKGSYEYGMYDSMEDCEECLDFTEIEAYVVVNELVKEEDRPIYLYIRGLGIKILESNDTTMCMLW